VAVPALDFLHYLWSPFFVMAKSLRKIPVILIIIVPVVDFLFLEGRIYGRCYLWLGSCKIYRLKRLTGNYAGGGVMFKKQ
jgi:hypothetical protein